MRRPNWLRTTEIVVLVILLLGVAFVASRARGGLLHSKEAVLKHDLQAMREAIDRYTADNGRPPQSLQALVDERYLRNVPTDPITLRDDWVAHLVTVNPDGGNPVVGVDDVHAGTTKMSSEGTRYNE